VEGEDLDTPDYLRGDRVRLGRGDLESVVLLPWLAHGEAPRPYITIPQYQFNYTKQHTHIACRNRTTKIAVEVCASGGSAGLIALLLWCVVN